MDIGSWLVQLRKGAAELVVLSIVARGERYGVEILERANGAGEIVTEGGLYPLLSRLEKDGKLTSRWSLEQGPHPRKYYRITAEGADFQRAMATAWTEFRDAMSATVEDVR